MLVIATVCASILSASPGCVEITTTVYNVTLPTTCVMKAQEVFSQASYGPGTHLHSFGCRRRAS